MELGELLATNITTMGVTASASDGLTTLVGKVANISTSGGGGNCYNAKFTESSYITDWDFSTSKNVATLKVYCQYQYEASTTGTVSINGDGNTYSASIGSDGYATADVELTSSSATFTVTYQGSTDTCTVTKRSFIFKDACSSNANLSEYGSAISVYNTSISGTPTLAYDSTNNAYSINGTSTGDWVVLPISDLNGENNFTFSIEMKINRSNSYPYFGFAVFPSESSLSSTYAELFYSYRYSSSNGIYTYAQRRRRTTSSTINSTSDSSFDSTQWFRLVVTFNSSNGVTARWEKLDGTEIKTVTTTVTASTSDRHYGLFLRGSSASYKGYVRNIKAWSN